MTRIGHVELPDTSKTSRTGDGHEEIELEFRGLTTADKDLLAKFFKDDARGMVETFGYEDHNGTTRVRFNEAALVFAQYAVNSWDTTIRLLIV